MVGDSSTQETLLTKTPTIVHTYVNLEKDHTFNIDLFIFYRISTAYYGQAATIEHRDCILQA